MFLLSQIRISKSETNSKSEFPKGLFHLTHVDTFRPKLSTLVGEGWGEGIDAEKRRFRRLVTPTLPPIEGENNLKSPRIGGISFSISANAILWFIEKWAE
jgi:hypothetical protein